MQTLEMTDTALLHKNASFHRYEVFHSDNCGCFFCGETFTARQITEWTDNNLTALCPHCHMDAVVPSSAQMPVTSGMLADMNRYAF
jgi:5-methylcytosine-specific restriction endonuclease McrA